PYRPRAAKPTSWTGSPRDGWAQTASALAPVRPPPAKNAIPVAGPPTPVGSAPAPSAIAGVNSQARRRATVTEIVGLYPWGHALDTFCALARSARATGTATVTVTSAPVPAAVRSVEDEETK